MNARLTLIEQFTEREYRISERLGVLCADGPVTASAMVIAEAEADEWVRRYNGVTVPARRLKQSDLL